MWSSESYCALLVIRQFAGYFRAGSRVVTRDVQQVCTKLLVIQGCASKKHPGAWQHSNKLLENGSLSQWGPKRSFRADYPLQILDHVSNFPGRLTFASQPSSRFSAGGPKPHLSQAQNLAPQDIIPKADKWKLPSTHKESSCPPPPHTSVGHACQSSCKRAERGAAVDVIPSWGRHGPAVAPMQGTSPCEGVAAGFRAPLEIAVRMSGQGNLPDLAQGTTGGCCARECGQQATCA